MGASPAEPGGLPLTLAHASEHARWGAVRAASESLPLRPRTELIDRLGAALADSDSEVRKQAFEGLEASRKSGQAPRPSQPALESLASRVDDSPESARTAYWWVLGRPDLASRAAEAAARHPSEKAKAFAATCREIAAGTHLFPCSICSRLEDLEFAGRQENLPNAFRLLVTANGGLECPECGAHYSLEWSEMYTDDFGGSIGNYEVRRLDDPRRTRIWAEIRKVAPFLPKPLPSGADAFRLIHENLHRIPEAELPGLLGKLYELA